MNCSDDGCLTAAVMFGTKGVRILAAGEVGGELHLLVETSEQVEGADPAASSRSRTGAGSTCCATPRSSTGPWW